MTIILTSVIVALVLFLIGAKYAFKAGHQEGYDQGKADAMDFYFRTFTADDGTKVTLEYYEAHALSTVASKIHDDPPRWFDHITRKLNGEVGEFSEHLGKASRDDDWDMRDGPGALTPERRMSLLKELGDILWYVVTTAKALGSSLAEVAFINITKRNGRKARGTLKGDGDNR